MAENKTKSPLLCCSHSSWKRQAANKQREGETGKGSVATHTTQGIKRGGCEAKRTGLAEIERSGKVPLGRCLGV